MVKKEKCFNLFQGFPWQKDFLLADEKEIEERCEMFKKSRMFRHINHILCDDVEVGQKYLHNYIAHMFQKPTERTDTFIIFLGKKGAGKDMFGILLSYMLGTQHYYQYEQLEELFKPFNSEQQGKILININEITDKGNHFDKHDKLKHIITQSKLNVKMKYMNDYPVDCCARYIGFTNNLNPIYMTTDERRFVEYKMPDLDNGKDYLNKSSYFTPIWSEEVNNPDFIKSAFFYYCSRDISGFQPRIHPKLEYQEKQKEVCLSKSIIFIIELFREIESGESNLDEYKMKKMIHILSLIRIYIGILGNGVLKTAIPNLL